MAAGKQIVSNGYIEEHDQARFNYSEGKTAAEQVMKRLTGDSFDICDSLYRVIVGVKPDEQSRVFEYICENYGLIESNEEVSLVPSEYSAEKSSYEDRYADFVDSILEMYLKMNLEEDEFYSRLWDAIREQPLLEGEGARTFAFYRVLSDKRIPYFYIDTSNLYSLSNESFRKMRSDHSRDIQRVKFILNKDFDQKTERSSVLLREFGVEVPDVGAGQEEVELYERRLVEMIEIVRSTDADETTLSSLIDRLI